MVRWRIYYITFLKIKWIMRYIKSKIELNIIMLLYSSKCLTKGLRTHSVWVYLEGNNMCTELSGKVEFNACQVSLLWHNSFLVSLWTLQPTLIYLHPIAAGFYLSPVTARGRLEQCCLWDQRLVPAVKRLSGCVSVAENWAMGRPSIGIRFFFLNTKWY